MSKVAPKTDLRSVAPYSPAWKKQIEKASKRAERKGGKKEIANQMKGEESHITYDLITLAREEKKQAHVNAILEMEPMLEDEAHDMMDIYFS